MELKPETGFVIDMSVLSPTPNEVGDKLVTRYSFYSGNTSINRYVKCSYELGYVFGAYLSIGSSRIRRRRNNGRLKEEGEVSWYLVGEIEEGRVSKLRWCVHQAFGVETHCRYRKPGNLEISVFRAPIAKLFTTFKRRKLRRIPEQFLVDNVEYLTGIHDAILDFDGALDQEHLTKSPTPQVVSNYTIPLMKLLSKHIDTQEVE